MRIRRSDSGVVLIAVIWILTMLILFVFSVGYRVLLELRLSKYYAGRIKASCMAKAGYYRALAELDADEDRKIDGLNESWANDEDVFKEVKLGDGSFTVSYVYDEGRDGERTFYGVMDEQSKLNLNRATEDQIRKMDILTDEQVDSIMDWTDTDSDERPGGAEEDYYQEQEIPYSCRDGNFKSVEELLLVKGMTPETFSELKDLVTVYGNGRININTVSPEVMSRALGFRDSLIDKIMDFREGNDNLAGTEDDNVFSSVSAISKELSETMTLGPEEGSDLNAVLKMLSVSSGRFRIISRGEAGGARVTVTCVVERHGKSGKGAGEKGKPGQSEKEKGEEKKAKSVKGKVVYWHEDRF